MAVSLSRKLVAAAAAGTLLLTALPAAAAADGAGMPEPDSIRVYAQVNAAQMQATEGAVFDGTEAACHLTEGGTLSFSMPVPADGRYQIELEYRLETGGNAPLECTLAMGDGEAAVLQLPRVYRDTKAIEPDEQGNDVKPDMQTVDEYVRLSLRQPGYKAGDRYELDMLQGEARLLLRFSGPAAYIRAVRLIAEEKPSAYVRPSGASDNGESIVVEAERAQYKTNSTLVPVSDRTSAATTPYHYAQIRLNTIGGSSWKTPGDWISWEIPVTKAGYYTISLRIRQNITRGMNSYRRIRLDGQVPCSELESFAFSYNRGWQVVTLGNETEDFVFYLEPGLHTLSMEAVMGSAERLYEKLSANVDVLNQLYRKIVKITGVSPDVYRTYHLDTSIPGLIEELTARSGELKAMVKSYEAQGGETGSELSVLLEMASLLDGYARQPEKIASTLSTLESNISTMSTLLTTLTQQPLLVDKLQIHGLNASRVTAKAGFFDTLTNGVKRFFASFLTDYSQLSSGDGSRQALDVWITSSRDQANIVKAMIDDTFTPRTGIPVRLSLASAGLGEATMAGRGPDIALSVGRTVPIDMGARGVLADLSTFKGFDEVRGRFQESALNAYTYKNRVFALPETQDFAMMYVRSDILTTLGVKPPETWDDLMGVIDTLSQENMEVGIPSTLIGTRLVQGGLTYYQEGFDKTVFSTQEAYDIYKEFIRIYRDYEQPYNFNAGNRFKTGIMPIVIDQLAFFNTISALAPEIRGKWDMLMLPGTRTAQGEIRRGGDATGVACVLFKSCADPQAGFQFLDWWTGEEAQVRYGTSMENLLGEAGRYATANVNAFSRLSWTAEQQREIAAQRAAVSEIPEIPGSYIISRNLTNLFLDVMKNGAVLRESMIRYAGVMDAELARKQIEMEALENN